MKTSKPLLWLFLILFLAVPYAKAQDKTQPPPPPPPRTPSKHRMELIYIFEENAPEFIFVIDNMGFKSVSALKKFVSDLPAGSTLEWAPGCIRFGGEPLLSSEREMKDFKAFCAEKNINFILIPSG